MTTHELARLLLSKSDVEVLILDGFNGGGYRVENMTLTGACGYAETKFHKLIDAWQKEVQS